MKDFVFAFLFVASCTALSGFYYDNGVDQTVVHKHLNKREKKEMQSEILHLLGLEHRPRPVLMLPSKKKLEVDDGLSSAPRFLIDVYQSLTEEDSGELKLTPDLIEREFNVSDSDVHSMDEADIIMSFVNRGQHLHGIRHHHSFGRFWFDLSEVPAQTTVISAELRLYINLTMVQENMNTTEKADEEETEGKSQNFSITVYEIGLEDSLIYIDSMEIDSHQEGWVAVNVSVPLQKWLVNPEENFGLQLVCRLSTSGKQISAREVGLVGSHGNDKLQPFMVAFFRSSMPSTQKQLGQQLPVPPKELIDDEDFENDEVPKRSSRIRRQTPNNNKKRSKDNEEFGGWNPYADARLSRRSCQKKNLYVSFRDLGWQDWIIAPDGYAASYCNGECSFPLNAHMNASNHAIVQTLVHLMNPYRVPKPCCAPIKLSSISVLYFDDNSNVILKKYRNMVVKSCGCH
ncbi:bone morphogenetic protein 7-like isoform X2 [Daphnia pulex]|uniref:bone morphogenetic protein 7-like isoform X2 n=1 Tax=Daphnia pulex TaxID=6669 RepID=UPI001EDF7821|nr:bone morphogenetic protein 7-like isoform X2 [Daphnia pulex]